MKPGPEALTKMVGPAAAPEGYRLRHKLTWAQVHELRRIVERGATMADAAARFRVHRKTVRQVVDGHTWKCDCGCLPTKEESHVR